MVTATARSSHALDFPFPHNAITAFVLNHILHLPHYLSLSPPPLQTTQAFIVNVDSNNTVAIIVQSHRRSRRSHFASAVFVIPRIKVITVVIFCCFAWLSTFSSNYMYKICLSQHHHSHCLLPPFAYVYTYIYIPIFKYIHIYWSSRRCLFTEWSTILVRQQSRRLETPQLLFGV